MAAANNSSGSWGVRNTFLFILLLLLMFLFGLLFPGTFGAWIAVLILLIVSVGFIGQHKNGFYHGLLIDERNKISLSRLQIICWTILVLSAFITAGTGNMRTYYNAHKKMEGSRGPEENALPTKSYYESLVEEVGEDAASEIPLDEGQILEELTVLDAFAKSLSIAVPEELWLLMGISTTTLIGTPLIRSNKTKTTPEDEIKNKKENDAARDAQADRQGVKPDKVAVQGKVLVNKDPAMARFGDLFETEYVGNVSQLDLTKVQNFYFTAILVLLYAALLGITFTSVPIVTDMPAFSSSVLALLGISSAGYLVGKAVPTNINATKVQTPGAGKAPVVTRLADIDVDEDGVIFVQVNGQKFQDGLTVSVSRVGGAEGEAPLVAELEGEVQAGSFLFKFHPAEGDDGPWKFVVNNPDGHQSNPTEFLKP